MSMMRNTLVTSACIFMCRMTGMLREVVFGAIFGVSWMTDAFNVAFRVPNLLRDLFAEGALSQSYTSVASKTRQVEGDAAAWELTAKIATQLSTIMIAIVSIGIMFAGPISEFLYLGSSPSAEKLELTATLNRIMWPFIGFASLSALVMGALNMVGVFGLPMLASAAFNIVSLLTGLSLGYWFDPSFKTPYALCGFAIGVTLGGLAQWLVQVPKLRQAGFRWKLNFHWKDPKVYKIWGLMLPSVFASGVTQFNVLINTTFATGIGNGAVTSLSYAFKVWQLPVGLFGVATGMVVLPSVARMMVGEGKNEIAEHIAKALRFVALFAVPSAVVLLILGGETISVIFQRGKFLPQDSIFIGEILRAYAIGLLGYAGTKVIQPVFLALEKRWIPLLVSILALCVSLSLNYTFVRIWHKDASWLALSTSIITTLNFLYYFIYLRRQLGGICGGMLASGLSRIVIAGGGFAFVCWAFKRWLMQDFVFWGFIDRLLMMGAVVGFGAIVYVAIAWVLRVPELDLLRAKFAKRRD